jgi:hypothetical protein
VKKDSLSVLVKVVDDIPVVSTLDMWEPLEVDHNTILKMVKKYESKFQDIRTFGFEIQKSGGRPTSFCHLDEEQATFLITLMRNSDPVVNFKHRMSREFYRMKTEILRLQSLLSANHQNAEWLETRADGKPVRRAETDVIQRYVDYAISQGSQHADKYFTLISKMANDVLFDVAQKCKNVRNLCNINQLKVLSITDTIIARALEEGMALKIHYKQIFQDVKTKVMQFAKLYGKSSIPDALVQIEQRPTCQVIPTRQQYQLV